MAFRKKIPLTITLLLIILLPACLLTRLHQTQKQVCTQKTRLEMTRAGIAIVFDQPLLTRADIVSILGARPGSDDPEGADLVYVARNKNDDMFSFPVTFQFETLDKEYRLTRVSIGKRFQDHVSEDMLRKLFNAGCSARRKGLGIEVDLSTVPRDTLPKPDIVRKLFGRAASEKAGDIAYDYEFNRDADAEISLSYDNDSLAAAGIFFQNYELLFDFRKAVANARLKSFSEAVRLGLKP